MPSPPSHWHTSIDSNINVTFFFTFTVGIIPGPESYFLEFSNIFVTCCGTNFYSQCLPPQTVNLAFSAIAMHWLREKPCNVKGAFDHYLVEDPETEEKLKKQAAEDWELLLLLRAKELVPG